MNERNAEIIKRHEAGATYGQIANAMGLTRSTVSGVVFRNRTDSPNPSRTCPDKREITDGARVFDGAQEAAEYHGITRIAAYQRARSGSLGWGFHAW